jgi:lipopolysaccharide export system protein LptC
MRGSGAALFPIGLMALLAAATFWLDRATQVDEGRDGKHRHDPDYIVDNFNIRRFDADGALQHSLFAQKMLHYPDDDSTEVAAPKLTYFRDPPVHVSSDTAWIDRDGKHVKLDGDVRIVRDAVAGKLSTQITTSVLYAVPDDDVAHTDAPVTITQGQTVVNGTGMETNNKTHISVLYGPVRGTIYPNQTAQTDAPHETTQSRTPTPATAVAGQPSRPATGVRGKGRQGQARKSRSRPHHSR